MMKKVILVISSSLLFRAFIINFLYPFYNSSQKLFILDLLGVEINLIFFTVIFGVINLLLLFYIGKKIFNESSGMLLSLLYAISPWSAYLELAGSAYVIAVTGVLIVSIGLIKLIKEEKEGEVFLISGILIASLSGIILSLCLPITLLITSFFYKRISKVRFFLIAYMGLLFLIILLFKESFLNLLVKENTIFSDPGIITTINNLRGIINESGFEIIGKLVANKYIYLLNILLFHLLKNVSPVIYFSSEVNIFSFSYAPPIFLGLLIFFLYGLYMTLSNNFKRIIFLLPLALVLLLPSVLDKNSPNLEKLFLTSPLVFLLIYIGYKNVLYLKNKLKFFILLSVATLVLIQSFVFLIDLRVGELIRLDRVRFTYFYENQ